MKSILFLAIILLACCARPGEAPKDVRPNIVAAFEKYWASIDTGRVFVIDTIVILKLDTLTPKSEMEFRISALLNRVDRLRLGAGYLQQMYELSAEKAILNASLFGRDNALTNISKREAEKAKEEVTSNLDLMKRFLSQSDSLNKLVLSGQLDSITFIGYKPWIRVSAVNSKSGVASADSVTMRLDSKFHILDYEDLK